MAASTVQTAPEIQLSLKEQAAAEASSAKASVSTLAWMEHLSKMLMVFIAIANSNDQMNAIHKKLDKMGFMEQIVYNALKNCSSLDELEGYSKGIAGNAGAITGADPSLGAFASQLANEIASIKANFQGDPKKDPVAYDEYMSDHLSILMTNIEGFSTEGQKQTDGDAFFAKNAQGERETLTESMKTLTSVNVPSASNPGIAAEE